MTTPSDQRIDELITLIMSWIVLDYTHRGDLPRDKMREILDELLKLRGSL